MKKKQEGPTFNSLKSTLREGKIERVYLLGGEEGYLAENLISSIVAATIFPGFEAVDCVRLDGSSRVSPPDLDRLEREAATPAFASARRVVIARNSGLFAGRSGKGSKQPGTGDDTEEGEQTGREVGKDQQKRLIALLDSLSQGICLVFHEDRIDRGRKRCSNPWKATVWLRFSTGKTGRAGCFSDGIMPPGWCRHRTSCGGKSG